MRTRGPDFFLVGAPKCGTTAIHAYLRQHPQVYMPAQKELHYYGSDLHGLPTTLRPEQHDALFEGAGDADRVGVTTMSALYSREAAREIKAGSSGGAHRHHAPRPDRDDLRAAQRAPVSGHRGHRQLPAGPRGRGRTPVRAVPLPASYPAALYDYRAIATFSEQVGHYFATFGEARVHVILQEDLKRNPAAVIRGLLTFLGVDPSIRPMSRRST